MGLIIGFLIGGGYALLSMALIFINKSTGATVTLMLLPLVFFLFLRFSFYFPSKATGNTLSLMEAYKFSKGYVWEMFVAGVFASWRVIVLAFAYMFLSIFLLVSIDKIPENTMFISILGVLLALPLYLYFQPILSVIYVTVLSNYYQHALQNKPIT